MPPPAPLENIPAEYRFCCHKAMFGELYGETLTPIRCVDNRVYLSLQCLVHCDNATEKYKYKQEVFTFSVGHNGVQQVLVYFGSIPSFVAIETSPHFARVACRRIGKEVLVPGSPDPKKRYIILALASSFRLDGEAKLELSHLMSCITPWAKLNVLSLEAAHKLIGEASLDVNQEDKSYSGIGTKFNRFAEAIFLYKPGLPSGPVLVTNMDVESLTDETYVNEIIMDFYLKYLYENILTPRQREKTYIHNSYFYKRLESEQVLQWSTDRFHGLVENIHNTNIFERDFVIIPVNEQCHWYVVVICFPGLSLCLDFGEEDEEDEDATVILNAFCMSTKDAVPDTKHFTQAYNAKKFIRPCILVFDSLDGIGHSQVFENLRHYLTEEWALQMPNRLCRIFDKTIMKGCYPKIPRQSNDYDGGVFVLQNVECFFTRCIKSFRMPVHLESWFAYEQISKKRKHILNIIAELAASTENN